MANQVDEVWAQLHNELLGEDLEWLIQAGGNPHQEFDRRWSLALTQLEAEHGAPVLADLMAEIAKHYFRDQAEMTREVLESHKTMDSDDAGTRPPNF